MSSLVKVGVAECGVLLGLLLLGLLFIPGSYVFCRDQGSIISGILALIAGVVAYGGAMHAAKIQVAALKEQNAALKGENRRKLARDSIVAIRLLSGVVRGMKDDSKRIRDLLQQPQYMVPNAIAPTDWRQSIAKPPLAVVWNSLGLCGREIIETYLVLDAKVEEFARRDVPAAKYMREQLAGFMGAIDILASELDAEAKRCLDLLAENA
jgi:hypothetical protein